MEEKDFENLRQMLNDASNIEIQTKAQTFFDVSGYPHYENVMSNILAFFFNPNEEHGFKDLWIKSLIECYNKTAGKTISLGSVETVEREIVTDEGKRIDIVIALDNAAIAIENKIFAPVNNDLGSYHKKIKKDHEEKEIMEILLTKDKSKHEKGEGYCFYNITYQNFLGCVKENLGEYIADANAKWLIFAKEVMKNIENLGENKMNEKWETFLCKNREIIQQFFDQYFSALQQNENYMQEIANRLREDITKNELVLPAVDKITYNMNYTENNYKYAYFSIFIDIRKDKETITFEPFIMKNNPYELIIALWVREGNKECNWKAEKEVLKKDFPKLKTTKEYNKWGNTLILGTLNINRLSKEELSEKLYKIVKNLSELYQEK